MLWQLNQTVWFCPCQRLWREAVLIKNLLLSWHGPALPEALHLLMQGLLEPLFPEVYQVHLGLAFLSNLVREACSGSVILRPLQPMLVLQSLRTIFLLLLPAVSPMCEQSLSQRVMPLASNAVCHFSNSCSGVASIFVEMFEWLGCAKYLMDQRMEVSPTDSFVIRNMMILQHLEIILEYRCL